MWPLSGLALLNSSFLVATFFLVSQEEVEKCVSVWGVFVEVLGRVFYGQGGVVCALRSTLLGLLAEKPYDTHPENSQARKTH